METSKKFFSSIFRKSPWSDEDEGEENIFVKRRKKNFNFDNFNFNFNFDRKLIYLAAGLVALLWLSSGIYQIKEGEEGLVTRFGKYERIGKAGLNYRLPTPFEEVIIEKVNQSRRIEIGYRSSGNSSKFRTQGSYETPKSITAESTMLTGDENIIDLNCDVMWHINDLKKFVFNVLSPEEAVKTASESAIREVIGETPILAVLSDQKQKITERVESLTQKILDLYDLGVTIEQVQLLKAEPPAEVIDAYRDVQTAKADKESAINQAQAYNNDLIPQARGKSAKILQEAEGYRQEVTSRAHGDAARFSLVYAQYKNDKQITKDRILLETLEKVLKESESKVIIKSGDLLPHMSILKKREDKN